MDASIVAWGQSKGGTVLDVVAQGRRVHVYLSAEAPADSGLDAVIEELRRGGRAEVVVWGGGGRNRIGTVLVRRTLLRQELRRRGIGVAIPARWVQADPDEAIRRWAQTLEIEVDDG